MSRMSDLYLDIEYLLEQGLSCERVSARLNVPINWVYSVFANMRDWDQDCYRNQQMTDCEFDENT